MNIMSATFAMGIIHQNKTQGEKLSHFKHGSGEGGLSRAERYGCLVLTSIGLIGGVVVLGHQWYNRKKTM